ncbi:hypothetical protein OGAPHI_002002 [Ogataea philodendri]|uniref:Uncharacterized protein n=1 Tax=Ogataea philodendri TaxID=1378263 RepID=A0A9P8P9U5_9ASCO|nr:uncharacterized protein OGAPHI_002002 [Ogataea philodendri]KAH3668248.1 hypothetical protein OGAPHI_002002 [Ogataea philodendri]
MALLAFGLPHSKASRETGSGAVNGQINVLFVSEMDRADLLACARVLHGDLAVGGQELVVDENPGLLGIFLSVRDFDSNTSH